MAKANSQWRSIRDGDRALVIVSGPEAYVSPSWYPSKAEHGKVVPTWNYVAVHLAGTVSVHRDPAWLLEAVTDLTNQHEQQRSEPWHVSDAPPEFIDSQLKAIIGIEILVDRVEAKVKASQNRPEQDQLGVIAGLAADTHQDADGMLRVMRSRRPDDRPTPDAPDGTTWISRTERRTRPPTARSCRSAAVHRHRSPAGTPRSCLLPNRSTPREVCARDDAASIEHSSGCGRTVVDSGSAAERAAGPGVELRARWRAGVLPRRWDADVGGVRGRRRRARRRRRRCVQFGDGGDRSGTRSAASRSSDRLARRLLPGCRRHDRRRRTARPVDDDPSAVEDTDAWCGAAATCDLSWIESPSNPLLHVADLRRIAGTARPDGSILAIDNTLAGPLAQQPLDLGVDIAVQSATKHLGGHSDLLCGVATTRRPELARSASQASRAARRDTRDARDVPRNSRHPYLPTRAAAAAAPRWSSPPPRGRRTHRACALSRPPSHPHSPGRHTAPARLRQRHLLRHQRAAPQRRTRCASSTADPPCDQLRRRRVDDRTPSRGPRPGAPSSRAAPTQRRHRTCRRPLGRPRPGTLNGTARTWPSGTALRSAGLDKTDAHPAAHRSEGWAPAPNQCRRRVRQSVP